MTAALPSPHQLGEAHSGLWPGCGGPRRGLPAPEPGVQSSRKPHLSPAPRPTPRLSSVGWALPGGPCQDLMESMTRTKLLPQPPPLPCSAFLVFFSIKISLCCSSIKARRINMWSGGRESPGSKAPGCPHPSSINPGLLSEEWFSVNLSYQQKPLKEFV